MKKRRLKKRIVLIIILVLLAIGGYYVGKKIYLKLNTFNVKVVDKIDNYPYTLDDRDTELFKSNFNELKNILNKSEIDEEAYAKLVAKLFVIDLYTMNNKINKYDIGGLDYVLPSAKENYQLKVQDTMYKYIVDNTNKKYGSSRLFSKMPDIRRRVDDELNRQKALDDLKFKRELDEIEAKRENIRQERNRMLRELQNQDIDDLDDPIYLSPSPPFAPPPMYNPYNPYMMPPPFNPYFMPPMNNNNHNDSTGDLIKIFLIKKLFDDNKPQSSDKNTYPPFFYPFYPGMPIPYGNNKGQPIINYPQPLIVQPPYAPPYQNPYKNKDNDSESQKGIPFIDPLEKYLEMVNKAKETSNNGDEGEDNGGNNKGEDDGEGDGGDEDGGGEGGEDGGDEDGGGEGGEDGGDEDGGGEGGEDNGEGDGEEMDGDEDGE